MGNAGQGDGVGSCKRDSTVDVAGEGVDEAWVGGTFEAKNCGLEVFAEVRRHMTADGYLLLENAEQAEDSTKLFEVRFASGCYVYRPSGEERFV